jgi:hypothetical protein
MEALVPDEQRVAAGQTGQAVGQICPPRHDRALDQDRNDQHAAGKGGLDLQPDKVIWIIQSAVAPLIGCGQPARADDRQQYLAGRHCTADFLGEVNTRPDRIDIHEDLAVTEPIGQAVSQPAREISALLPAIADKNAAALSFGHVRSRYRT